MDGFQPKEIGALSSVDGARSSQAYDASKSHTPSPLQNAIARSERPNGSEVQRKKVEQAAQGLPVQLEFRYIREKGELIVEVVDKVTGRVISAVPVDSVLTNPAGFRELVVNTLERLGDMQ